MHSVLRAINGPHVSDVIGAVMGKSWPVSFRHACRLQRGNAQATFRVCFYSKITASWTTRRST